MFQEYLNRHWLRVLLSLIILSFFLVHALKQHEWGLINRIESVAYDIRLLLTMPGTRDDRIVIVEIDEKSLAAEGRWPWPRDRVARLVDRLFDHYDVKLVAFDVVFAEPEETSALALLDELESERPAGDNGLAERYRQLRSRYDRDRVLVEAVDGRNVILGVFFFKDTGPAGNHTAGALPTPLFRRGSFTGRNVRFVSASGYASNLAELQSKAFATGHLVAVPDVDALIRRVPMLYEYDGAFYESLSLAVTRNVLGVESVAPVYSQESPAGRSDAEIEWLEVGDRYVPVDAHVTALVPFRGARGSFPYVSATDVISGSAPRDALVGRIILVGSHCRRVAGSSRDSGTGELSGGRGPREHGGGNPRWDDQREPRRLHAGRGGFAGARMRAADGPRAARAEPRLGRCHIPRSADWCPRSQHGVVAFRKSRFPACGQRADDYHAVSFQHVVCVLLRSTWKAQTCGAFR